MDSAQPEDRAIRETRTAYSKYVEGGNDRLVVSFSNFALRNYGPDAFSNQISFQKHYDKIDALYIKDARNQWYNRPIEGVGETVDEITQWIGERCARYKQVTMFGSSMGGYASLLYGGRIKAHEIITFAPQTFLSPPFPRYDNRIHQGSFIELAEEPQPVGETVILIGEDDLFDLYQVYRYSRKCELGIIRDAYHNVPAHWARDGRFEQAVEAICTGGWQERFRSWLAQETSDLLNHFDDDHLRRDVAVAVEGRYHGRFRESAAALERLLERFPWWMGAKAYLGTVLVELESYREAFGLLSDVEANRPAINDILLPLVKAAALTGGEGHQAAFDAALRGLRANPRSIGALMVLAKMLEEAGNHTLAAECTRIVDARLGTQAAAKVE